MIRMNKLKEINGKFYQEVEVAMLATDKNLKIGDLGLSANNILWNIKKSNFKEADVLYECVPQHLFFLSNEKPKEGDWCYDKILNGETGLEQDIVYQKKKGIQYADSSTEKKIVATTDTSLGLPQPSKKFIQAFIETYNKNKPITKVLIEIEGIGRMKSGGEFTPITYQLKVNSSNEITIKKVKDSWAREEVVELCKSAFITGTRENDIDYFEWERRNL